MRWTEDQLAKHLRAHGVPGADVPPIDGRDVPFKPPLECVLDLPAPPSVNRTRRLDSKGAGLVLRWVEQCDARIFASGGMKMYRRVPRRFEATIIFDESLVNLDLDNGVKAVIDYVRRVGLITDDSKKYMRRLVIEWGEAPHGCRLILREVA